MSEQSKTWLEELVRNMLVVTPLREEIIVSAIRRVWEKERATVFTRGVIDALFIAAHGEEADRDLFVEEVRKGLVADPRYVVHGHKIEER